jgi:hypothetical protein
MTRVVLVLAFLVPLVLGGYVVRSLLLPSQTTLGAGAAPTRTATAPPTSARATSAPTALPASAPTRTPAPEPTTPPVPTLAPPPAAQPVASPSPSAQETVVVANTGGLGGVLRDQPVVGKQIAALREGQPLTVIERTQVNGAEWVHVRTDTGLDGWISSQIVASATPTAP